MPQAINGTEGSDVLKRYHKRPIISQVAIKQQNPLPSGVRQRLAQHAVVSYKHFAKLGDYPPIGNRAGLRGVQAARPPLRLSARTGTCRVGSSGRGINNLLCDLSVGLNNHLLDLLRSLDRLGLVVYPLELLEGSALGLDAGGVIYQHQRNETLFGGRGGGGGTYQKRYHKMASIISQPTKMKMYL